MTYIIEARANTVIRYKALVYRATSYPRTETRISSYGRVMAYRRGR